MVCQTFVAAKFTVFYGNGTLRPFGENVLQDIEDAVTRAEKKHPHTKGSFGQKLTELANGLYKNDVTIYCTYQ